MTITGKTRIVGIIGDPVSHSLSPQMQNAAFTQMGLDVCYIPLHVKSDDLAAAVQGMRAMNFAGANVTIPHKVAVIEFLDDLADSARLAGAVNTLVFKDGRITGHNTDGEGFVRSLEEVISVDYRQSPVFMVGAGGGARGIAVALAKKGMHKLTILNRSPDRASALSAILQENFPALQITVKTFHDDYEDLLVSSKLVINATPIGMVDRLKSPPVDVDKLSGDHVVCDIVYTKSQETPFLVAARKKGATTLGGTGMLLHQGAAAIQLWMGEDPSIQVMRRAIES